MKYKSWEVLGTVASLLKYLAIGCFVLVYDHYSRLMFCFIKWSWILHTWCFGIPFLKNSHTNDYLRTLKCHYFSCLDGGLSPFSKYQFRSIHKPLDTFIKWSTKIECPSQTRLDTYKFSLPFTCAVVFRCLVFRLILSPFEATMTRAGLNVTLSRWKCAARVGGSQT